MRLADSASPIATAAGGRSRPDVRDGVKGAGHVVPPYWGLWRPVTMRRWADRVPDIVESLNARAPLRRAAEAEEIAEAVAWLLSDRASYVTGTILPIDGGLTA